MAQRNTLSLKLIQARKYGVPSVVANFSELMSSSTSAIKPIVFVSTNDVLADAHRDGATAFMTWHARPLVAEVIARDWADRHNVRDADHIMARAYGELAGMSAVKDQNTPVHCTAARTKVLRILRRNVPPINEIRSLVDEIKEHCGRSNGDMAGAEECAGLIPGGVIVSNQTLEFYRLRGHTLPWEWFPDGECRQDWINLGILTEHLVDMGEKDFATLDDVSHYWHNGQDTTILGYYEGKAAQMFDKSRGMIAGAVFCYLSTLTKVGNVTEGWVQRKKTTFTMRLPGLRLDNYINHGIVRLFATMYQQLDATWKDVYRQLALSWSLLQVPEGLPLTWIIEQSSNNNVTSLTTIADVTTRLRYFDPDTLMRAGIPQGNFRQAMRLAMHLLRNPFSSVVQPEVSIRLYADLAYLCTRIKSVHIRDAAFTGYRGQANSMCALTQAELDQIAASAYEISTMKAGAALDVLEIYLRPVNGPGFTVKQIGDTYFRVPIVAPRIEPEEGGDMEMHAYQAQLDMDRNQLRRERAGWPRQAMDLPVGTAVLSTEAMFDGIEANFTPHALAFKLVMNRMHANATQIPLNVVAVDAMELPSPERMLALDVVGALTL